MQRSVENQGSKNKRKKRRKRKKERNKKRSRKRKNKRKLKKKRTMEVKKIAEEWEIWDKEEEAVKSGEEAKKLVPLKFHEWIHVFERKVSKKMPTRKVWNHVIDLKEEFVLRKGKVYLLSKEKREEVCKFIEEQLRKWYIRLLNHLKCHQCFL